VLAHHAREADDANGIVEHAPRAARAALAASSHREAREHLRALEPHLDRFTPPDRAALLEDRARVEQQVDLAVAADAVSQAIELRLSAGTDRELARALTQAVRIYEMARRHSDAHAAAAESVQILRKHRPDRDLAFALSWTAWLKTIGSEAGEGTEAADEAVRAAESVGDEQSMIAALMVKGMEMVGRGDPGCIEVLEDARRRAERSRDPEQEIRALLNMSVHAQERHDLEWAIDLTRRGCSIAARHELPNSEAHARVQLAWALLHGGRWLAAHDILTEVLGSSRDPDEPHHHSLAANTELTATIARATLHIRMGRPEADATLDRLGTLVEAIPWSTSRASLGLVTAERSWLSDQHDERATAMLRDALDAGVRSGPSVSRSTIALWLWEHGELARLPERVVEPVRLLVEGRPTEAAALWGIMGYPYYQALALMHGNDDERLGALRILEDLGAAATAGKLRRALRADGVRIPRGEAPATRRHPAGLTARQAEVLELLTEGLSNREIADRLFISERTTEHHVTAILTKLGVTTRYEAVDAARDLGLLTGR
jgi:DNA-binding CsgD family transcriptional regulator